MSSGPSGEQDCAGGIFASRRPSNRNRSKKTQAEHTTPAPPETPSNRVDLVENMSSLKGTMLPLDRLLKDYSGDLRPEAMKAREEAPQPSAKRAQHARAKPAVPAVAKALVDPVPAAAANALVDPVPAAATNAMVDPVPAVANELVDPVASLLRRSKRQRRASK